MARYGGGRKSAYTEGRSMGGLFMGIGVFEKLRSGSPRSSRHYSMVNRSRAEVARRRGNYVQKRKRQEYLEGFKEGVSIMKKMDAEGRDYSDFKSIYGFPQKGRR